MAVCPECGERVPFGGGRTVKNAHLMFNLARELRLYGEGLGEDEFTFAEKGEALARSLHDYGHKRSMVNPNWEAAGVWTRVAREAVELEAEGRTTIEWLAAQYRDFLMLPADEAMQRAEADYAENPDEATEKAATFAALVEGMTGVRDPRRIGNWRSEEN